MRRALNVEPIINDNVFIGFVLGGDHVSEHEWGINGIKSILGIPLADDGLIGIDKRKSARPTDTDNVLVKSVTISKKTGDKTTKQKFRVLYVAEHLKEVQELNHLAKSFVKSYESGPETTLFGAWDNNHFVIISSDEEMRGHIDTLAQSIISGDVAAWFGRFNNNPFIPAGLAVTIASRIPEEKLAAMRNADIARNELLAAAKETGIESRLKAAGLRWFALSPRLANDNEAKQTSHNVVFWLNPYEQSQNNYGWFTVEELDQWVAGEGPIPKNPKSTPAPR